MELLRLSIVSDTVRNQDRENINPERACCLAC